MGGFGCNQRGHGYDEAREKGEFQMELPWFCYLEDERMVVDAAEIDHALIARHGTTPRTYLLRTYLLTRFRVERLTRLFINV